MSTEQPNLTANLVSRTGIDLSHSTSVSCALDDALAAYRKLLDSGVEAASIAFIGRAKLEALVRIALFITQHIYKNTQQN